jgi:hypothetical protein
MFIFNIKPLDVGLLHPRSSLNQGRSLCALLFTSPPRKLECVILTTRYFADAENTSSWCARRGDLQHAFPLDVSIVHSSALDVFTDGESLTCGGFFLGETVHFGSLEFIADCFSSPSHSPRRNDSGVVPAIGHDKGLHQGNLHGFKQRGGSSLLSHPVSRPKLNAYLYGCQVQVSHVKP